MATYYALPTLTAWTGSSTGWSLSSGGAAAGSTPTNADDVIFDANSGPARSVDLSSGSAICRSLLFSGSNAISLSGGSITVNGSINLTSAGPVTTTIQLGNPGTDPSYSLTSAGKLASANLSTDNGLGTLTLLDDLAIGTLGVNCHFNANNKNVTAGTFTFVGSSLTLTMGSGTWTLTGTGAVWNIPSVGTIATGTATIKISNTTASAKTFSGWSGTPYASLVIEATGTGGLAFSTGPHTFSSVQVKPGCAVSFVSGITYTSAAWAFDGTGATTTIKSTTAGSRTTLAKTGGGLATFDRCSVQDINGSPAATFIARSSTNVSNNANITFIPGNSNFFPFF